MPPKTKKLVDSTQLGELTRNGRVVAAHINYRDSQSWASPGSVVSLYINGDFQARCHGGGYDMSGTVLGDWMVKAFPEELKKLARGFSTEEYLFYPQGTQQLYGLHEYRDRVHLDGACGINAMVFMLNLMGYRWQYLLGNSSCRSNYAITKLQPDCYESNTLEERVAYLRFPMNQTVEVFKKIRPKEGIKQAWEMAGKELVVKREFLVSDLFGETISDDFKEFISNTYISEDFWMKRRTDQSVWARGDDSSGILLYRFGSNRQDHNLIEVPFELAYTDQYTWRRVLDELL